MPDPREALREKVARAMTTYYKAVRHDYGSFHDPSFKYGPVGTVVKHPNYKPDTDDAAHHISVATVPTDCTGFQWRVGGEDSRLLVVEPIGRAFTPGGVYANKRAVRGVRVVDELPISAAFGPNGDQVVQFLESLDGLTAKQWDATRYATRSAAGAAARDAAWVAAGVAAWDAARYAAWVAAGVAACALVVRDLITPEQFDVLVAPMRAAGVEFGDGDPS